MSVTDDLIARNHAYADGFEHGALPLIPALGLAVVTCMDARVDVHPILGLAPGDAHVIRNAGGVVTDDEIRSLVISQRKLHTTEVIVMQHTDCGMQTFTDDELKAELAREVGIKPAFAFEAFTDLADNLRQSVRRIRSSPFIPHRDGVRALVYDVDTGRVTEVDV